MSCTTESQPPPIVKSEPEADTEVNERHNENRSYSSNFRRGRKRHFEGGRSGYYEKRFRRYVEPSYHQPKNALLQLNELKPGLNYVIEGEEGTGHDRIFTASVLVNNEKFIGKGNSKQLAKHAAAEAALKSFVQFKNMAEVIKSLSRDSTHVDFTDDNFNADAINFDKENPFETVKMQSNKESSLMWQSRINHRLKKVVTEANKKNPVMLLNDLYPGVNYQIDETSAEGDDKYVASVTVEDVQYNGNGANKKLAKREAAREALSQKYGIHFEAMQSLGEEDKAMFDVPQEFADKVGRLVHDRLEDCLGDDRLKEQWRVLAGIVMSKDSAMEDLETICIATGARTIKGNNVHFKGFALNDCHAEVIVRRCLKDYLFNQLELHSLGKGEESIFYKDEKKFKLRPNIKFHFYATSLLCGDATICDGQEFDISEINLDTTEHGSGMLRSKFPYGTIPVGSFPIEQKIKSVRHGYSRYFMMSCSDKMTMWNVLGVQGSLLNYFIEPIYFETIIFGRPFYGYHLLNCLYKRIENTLEELPSPFMLHKPKLACTSTLSAKSPYEEKFLCMNWTLGLEKYELINAANGRPKDKIMSRLAKQSFLQKFKSLLNLLFQDNKFFEKLPCYAAVKMGSEGYHIAKDLLIKAFLANGHGFWKKKPMGQDLFDIFIPREEIKEEVKEEIKVEVKEEVEE